VDDLWATKSKDVVFVCAISFPDFQPMYVIMIHQRHRQTDGQTDDMRSQDRALHYSASRSKKGEASVN